jgi:hypothetical protein
MTMKRSEYLNSSSELLPGDYNEWRYGERGISPFISTDQSLIGNEFNKLSKFKPGDAGDSFQTFLTLQNNPNALIESRLKLPAGFVAFSQLSNM